MTSQELKSAAIARLRSLNIEIPEGAGFTVISDAISSLGQKRPYNVHREDYVRAWMTPQRVQAYVRPFRPLSTARHPRADDIDRSQPPFMTPRGAIGNGDEHSKVWRR